MSNEAKKNTKEGLQYELDTIEGTNKVKVIKDGKDSYVITFLDTNRNYKVQYGKEVEGPIAIDITEDAQAGDITKGNTLDGSKEKPYQINCIEDWVDFSNKSETDPFIEKEIIMTRNLDFLSELSYQDYQTTKYGDINNDGKTSELMEELTTSAGFKPINTFRGNFDGQNNHLNNLYINSDKGDTGLFSIIFNATIKNLILNGNLNGTTNIGGIVARVSGKCFLYNLEYSGTISFNKNKGAIGGIVGNISLYSEAEVNHCINKSNITAPATIGGIVGHTDDKIKIINCYNSGNLTVKNSSVGDYYSVGGMIGQLGYEGDIVVENCYNIGRIKNEIGRTYNGAGGIVGNRKRSGYKNKELL